MQVLELQHDFTANELKRAYRRESLANHPDKGGSVEGFQRVAAAQATMADRNKLDDYDKGTCVGGGGRGVTPSTDPTLGHFGRRCSTRNCFC